MGGSYTLLHDKDFHPLVYNVLIILPDKIPRYFLVFRRQRFNAFFMTYMNIYKFTVLND